MSLDAKRFIGVDLGWSSGATGLTCLELKASRLVIRAMACRLEIGDILAWIQEQADCDYTPAQNPMVSNGDRLTQQAAIADGGGGDRDSSATVIAVDAPTLIPNSTGMRVPDRLAHHYFRKYHAGCYPANLSRPFAVRTVSFGLQLEAMGFAHCPHLKTPQPRGQYQLEVFPHAAIIHLFQLNQILKYKKGRIAERRAELTTLSHLITTVLPQLTPALALPERPGYAPNDSHSVFPHSNPARLNLHNIPQGGKELKAFEDQLDSLICAYTAAHWWYWGQSRNWVLGDRASGYIVIPTPFGRLGQNI